MELEHLSPQSKLAALKPVRERVEFLQINPVFPIKPLIQIEDWLKDVIQNKVWSTHKPLKCILSPSGMGSSDMIKRLIAAFPPSEKRDFGVRSHQVVLAHSPIDGCCREIGAEICNFVHAPIHHAGGTSQPLTGWLKLLQQLETKLLVIDDMQSLLHLSKSKQAVVMNIIRQAISRYQINIGLIGPPQLHSIIRNDEQLIGRTHFVEVMPFTAKDPAFEAFLEAFTAWSPLQRKSDLIDDLSLRKALIRRSNGVTRNMMDILIRLSVFSIYSGQERINYDLWREYFTRGEYE